jgi:uncharacterized protein
MPQTYFADTWYFIALLDPRDAHHHTVRRLEEVIEASSMVTHDAVLTEFLTYFADEGAHQRSLAGLFVRRALARLNVISGDRPLFLRALTRYEQRPDKEYSLVDCMSMVVMEERGIRHVLTNDHHFTQAGFTVVNR